MAAPPHVGAEMMRAAIAVVPELTSEAAVAGRGTPPAGSAPASERGSIDDAGAIAALVERGDHRAAIAACARTHGAVIGRLCMALLGSQADAEEATQDTLLRAHRAMATYRGEGSVNAWLCGIARHVCAHMLETRRRGRALVERVSTDEAAPDAIASGRRTRAVRRALDQLKPSERDALVLRYVAELSHRELAATMNLDEAAARKRISRALAHLRAVMPDQEID